MKDIENDINAIKIILQATREKLFNLTLSNIELEATVALQNQKISELEKTTSGKSSSSK